MQSDTPTPGLNFIPVAVIVWPAAIAAVTYGTQILTLALVISLAGLLVRHRRWRVHCLVVAVLISSLFLTVAAGTDELKQHTDSEQAKVAIFETAVVLERPAEAIQDTPWGGYRATARPASAMAKWGEQSVKIARNRTLILTFESTEAKRIQELAAGQRITVRGRVQSEGSTIFLDVSSWDYAAQAREHSTPLQEAPGERGGVLGWISAWRSRLQEKLKAATDFLPADESALVRGMSLGDTDGMSRTTQEAMKVSGLTHLVAVSGANVALVYAFVSLPFMFLGIPRKPRVVCAGVAIAVYALAVGGEPSLMRAATMAIPLMIGRYLGVRTPALRALALTVVVWSVGAPWMAGEFGFVLSVVATAGILTLARPCAELIRELTNEKLGETAALACAVPIVAQAACTPVLILLRPEISLWSVAANILAEFVVAPATIAAFMGLVLMHVHPILAWPFFMVSGCGAHILVLIAQTAAGLPGSHIALPEGSSGALLTAGIITIIALALWLRRLRPVRWALAVCAVLLLATSALRFLTPAVREWDIALCDVGQGDALFVQTGQGGEEVLAIDTGPDPEAWRACAEDFGITSISLLVITHPHADHNGGVNGLTGERAPKSTWICPLDDPRHYGHLGNLKQVHTGLQLSLGSLELSVLWPPDAHTAKELGQRENGGEESALNDCSIGLRIDQRNWTMVALGDLEPLAQESLAKSGPFLQADVVKVAHHGSKRQYAPLYNKISANAALIGVGNNSFGHPHPHTLRMLGSTGAVIARTDLHGHVALRWLGSSFELTAVR